MSSFFSYEAAGSFPAIPLNNGLTDVVIEELCTAASWSAQDDHQREIACWLASHDRSIRGDGMCGFDFSELPWSSQTLEADRAFCLKIIGAARRSRALDKDLVLFFDQLAAMAQAFKAEHIRPENDLWWKPTRYELCTIHHIYKHVDGCLRCNAVDANNNSANIERSLG